MKREIEFQTIIKVELSEEEAVNLLDDINKMEHSGDAVPHLDEFRVFINNALREITEIRRDT